MAKSIKFSRITVRRAASADLPALNALEAQTFSAQAITPRQMRYLLNGGRCDFFVALGGSKLLGAAISLTRRHANGRRTGRIYSIAVAQEARRHGVGRRLMRRLLHTLAERAVPRIHLEVEATNAPAIRLYEQLGFAPLQQVPHFYGRGKHALRMRLEPPAIQPRFS